MALLTTTNETWLIIDAGGTYLKSALLNVDGTICASSCFSTFSCSQGTLEQIKKAFEDVLSRGMEYCSKNQLCLKGIGVAIPGPFDYHRGISLMKHKYQSLYGLDVRDFLVSTGCFDVDLPVWFVHDVNAVLAGEQWRGSARSFKNVAVVTLGTGLGFACLLDGKIQSSELGSPLFSMYNRPCRDGILEDYASQRGILHIYKVLNDKVPDWITVKDIAALAQMGDELALQTFRMMALILAESLYPFLEEKRIECLLFGGQISRSFPLMENTLKRQLRDITALMVIDTVSSIDNAAFWGTLVQRERLSFAV